MEPIVFSHFYTEECNSTTVPTSTTIWATGVQQHMITTKTSSGETVLVSEIIYIFKVKNKRQFDSGPGGPPHINESACYKKKVGHIDGLPERQPLSRNKNNSIFSHSLNYLGSMWY